MEKIMQMGYLWDILENIRDGIVSFYDTHFINTHTCDFISKCCC